MVQTESELLIDSKFTHWGHEWVCNFEIFITTIRCCAASFRPRVLLSSTVHEFFLDCCTACSVYWYFKLSFYFAILFTCPHSFEFHRMCMWTVADATTFTISTCQYLDNRAFADSMHCIALYFRCAHLCRCMCVCLHLESVCRTFDVGLCILRGSHLWIKTWTTKYRECTASVQEKICIYVHRSSIAYISIFYPHAFWISISPFGCVHEHKCVPACLPALFVCFWFLYNSLHIRLCYGTKFYCLSYHVPFVFACVCVFSFFPDPILFTLLYWIHLPKMPPYCEIHTFMCTRMCMCTSMFGIFFCHFLHSIMYTLHLDDGNAHVRYFLLSLCRCLTARHTLSFAVIFSLWFRIFFLFQIHLQKAAYGKVWRNVWVLNDPTQLSSLPYYNAIASYFFNTFCITIHSYRSVRARVCAWNVRNLKRTLYAYLHITV